jgi:hypothetical protein
MHYSIFEYDKDTLDSPSAEKLRQGQTYLRVRGQTFSSDVEHVVNDA